MLGIPSQDQISQLNDDIFFCQKKIIYPHE